MACLVGFWVRKKKSFSSQLYAEMVFLNYFDLFENLSKQLLNSNRDNIRVTICLG
jgi:hypothetical protein